MADRPGLMDRLLQIVETRRVKLLLAALILLSVVPIPRLYEALRPLFLGAFGLELVVRIPAALRPREERPHFERLLLLVDLLAFLSFLPVDHWVGPQWRMVLTVLRLSRLLVLLRFARELAVDVYSIVTRREQLQQFGLVTGAVWALSFGTAVLLEQLGVAHDYDGRGAPGEDDFIDRLWWAFRQLESSDNLVENLRVHPLIAVLSLGLTIVGVFVISFIIGIGANVVDQVVRAERRRPIDYAGHSLVIGGVHQAEILVEEFVRLYERNRSLRRIRASEVWQWLWRGGPLPRRHALPQIALLGAEDEPPAYLYDPLMRWVVYRQGDGTDAEALSRVGAARAKRALILSREDAGPDADSVTTLALASFRAQNPNAQVLVEVMRSDNLDLVASVGGPGTFPLDMPRFLGLFLCQHLVTPGVEALYVDLMNAEGSEFYTHIFVEQRELSAVQALSPDDGGEYVSFERMARWAYRERGIVLSGVFLGDKPPVIEKGIVSTEGLVQWLNPMRDPPDDARMGLLARSLGARAGRIPVRALRGLIGVTSTYAPLKRYGRDLVMRRGLAAEGEGPFTRTTLQRWTDGLRMQRGLLARVLVVGYSGALPSMLAELSRFVPGLRVTLVLGERGDERLSLEQRLASLGIGLEERGRPPGEEGVTVALEQGGSVTVYTMRGPDLAPFAVKCARRGNGPIGAAVFLSEPDAVDRDARTSMRVLRFVRAMEAGEVPHADRMHLLAEFHSVDKGEHVRKLVDHKRCGFAHKDHLRLSLVSTDRIKNYFLVHSAFVPGVNALYEEILGEEGQEIVRLEPDPARGTEGLRLRFGELIEALGPRAVIPIGLELSDGSVLLNPPGEKWYEAGEVTALYVLAESRDLEEAEVRAAREQGVVSVRPGMRSGAGTGAS